MLLHPAKFKVREVHKCTGGAVTLCSICLPDATSGTERHNLTQMKLWNVTVSVNLQNHDWVTSDRFSRCVCLQRSNFDCRIICVGVNSALTRDAGSLSSLLLSSLECPRELKWFPSITSEQWTFHQHGRCSSTLWIAAAVRLMNRNEDKSSFQS